MLPEIDFLKSDIFHSVITVILLSSTKKLLFQIWEMRSWNTGPEIAYTAWGLSWIFWVIPAIILIVGQIVFNVSIFIMYYSLILLFYGIKLSYWQPHCVKLKINISSEIHRRLYFKHGKTFRLLKRNYLICFKNGGFNQEIQYKFFVLIQIMQHSSASIISYVEKIMEDC